MTIRIEESLLKDYIFFLKKRNLKHKTFFKIIYKYNQKKSFFKEYFHTQKYQIEKSQKLTFTIKIDEEIEKEIKNFCDKFGINYSNFICFVIQFGMQNWEKILKEIFEDDEFDFD